MQEEEFITISAGVYRIGADSRVIETLDLGGNGVVKIDYLRASCPSHEIRIEEVGISKRLVTRWQFAEFVEITGHVTESEIQGWGWVWSGGRWRKRSGVSWRDPFASPADDRRVSESGVPVMQISWNDADAYCRWLSASTGIASRLPREGEWEVFARMCGVPGMGETGGECPAGSDPADFIGMLLDSSGGAGGTGLLWEWTGDWYQGYPGNPGNDDFGTVYRVLRGGSVLSTPIQRTREYRLRKCPTARSPYYGFRVAISPRGAA